MPDQQEPLTPAERTKMERMCEIYKAAPYSLIFQTCDVARALAMLDQLETQVNFYESSAQNFLGQIDRLEARVKELEALEMWPTLVAKLKSENERLKRATAERCAEIASEAADEWNNAGATGEARRTGVSAANEIAERIEREFGDAAIQREGQ